jgi:hypothetical protein
VSSTKVTPSHEIYGERPNCDARALRDRGADREAAAPIFTDLRTDNGASHAKLEVRLRIDCP